MTLKGLKTPWVLRELRAERVDERRTGNLRAEEEDDIRRPTTRARCRCMLIDKRRGLQRREGVAAKEEPLTSIKAYLIVSCFY